MTSVAMIGPHVAIGAAALLLYWRALLAVKGSARHRRAGRLYLLLLLPLLLTVLPITLAAAGTAGPARVAQLCYLALVLATAGWTAWRAVADRDDVERFRGLMFRGLAWAMLASGLGLMTLGIFQAQVLTFGFAMIGVVYGGAMLGFLGRAAGPGWSREWHLNGICLLFAATHASFIGLVARQLFPALAGEAMHDLTQLGTIAFAYCLRQWLGHRHGAGLPAGEMTAATR